MRAIAAAVMFFIAGGCAMTAASKAKAEKSCAFAYFLPVPLAIAVVGVCEFGPQDEPQEDMDV